MGNEQIRMKTISELIKRYSENCKLKSEGQRPATIADGMEKFLETDPRRESKSRVKRLRGIRDPDYRLRIGEYRVFYSVDDAKKRVNVLRVLHKDQTRKYYQEVQK